jgi:hypothetical protein
MNIMSETDIPKGITLAPFVCPGDRINRSELVVVVKLLGRTSQSESDDGSANMRSETDMPNGISPARPDLALEPHAWAGWTELPATESLDVASSS